MTYWDKRQQNQQRYIEQNLKDDKAFNAKLEKYYERTIAEINRDIKSELYSFAVRDGISYAEAKKKVSKADTALYKKEAAEVVRHAKELRKQGKRVSYAD